MANGAVKFAAGSLLVIATLSAYAQTNRAKNQTRSLTEACIAEDEIVRENKWTASNEFARYRGNDAHLFAETLSPDLMRVGSDYPFDTIVVWGGPDVWGFAVAVAFKNGCTLGYWFVGRAYSAGAQVVEKYRESGSSDIDDFLPAPKQHYYRAERYYSERRYNEAEQLYSEALNEFRNLGPYAASLNMTLHKIAVVDDALGKYDIAEKNYKLAIAGWHTSLGPGSVQEAEVRTDFVKMLRKIGREADAEAWSKQ